jgi:NAD-dependent SIR2 family protein deacetylase
MEVLNPGWRCDDAVRLAPDGDTPVEQDDIDRFVIPDCESCGGMLKPAVVFFGENVPAARVAFSMSLVAAADALLVVGSSLTVWSGFRFARAAHERGIPIAILNIGPTRADNLATLKIEAKCGELLHAVAALLC